MPNPFQDLIDQVVAFRDARDWSQFHDPKNLALALSIEAAELNERFLWKAADEADPSGVREELADVIIYALLLAHHYGTDPKDLVEEKLKTNGERYPVERSRGRADKYTEI
jgi:NTP pyrophosphatase (non-canonical NTP hydrolase)